MQALELRRDVFRRDLRSAVKDLTAIAEQRAARRRPADRRFRPLIESETEALVGADLLARLAEAGHPHQISQ